MATKNATAQNPPIEHPHIEKKPGVCGGEPVIKGTRISVRLIVGFERQGHTIDEIVGMYPHITHAQVHDALSYYYDHREEIDKLMAEKSEAAIREKYAGKPWMN